MQFSKFIMVACARNAWSAICKTGALLLLLTALSGVASASFPNPAPEIEAGSIASAVAVLGGWLLWRMDRSRRR